MASWDEIKKEVEENGSVLTVTMETLREAADALKIGVNVQATIMKELAGVGLGHIPPQLPNYQDELVRLYKQGTPLGDLINMVLKPGKQRDAKLIEKFGGEPPDYASIVEAVREIVGKD